mmetsp:Transcript_33024/g.60543  ORF Transcript_33024/g.60543 Transcript_33024/m.60543 type:complete len:429 (+) Transcript_33024:273-1559(+)
MNSSYTLHMQPLYDSHNDDVMSAARQTRKRERPSVEALLSEVWQLLKAMLPDSRRKWISSQFGQAERLALEQWATLHKDVKDRRTGPSKKRSLAATAASDCQEKLTRCGEATEALHDPSSTKCGRTRRRKALTMDKVAKAAEKMKCWKLHRGLSSVRDRRSGSVFHSVKVMFAKGIRLRTPALTSLEDAERLRLAVHKAVLLVRDWEEKQHPEVACSVEDAESFMQSALCQACIEEGLYAGSLEHWCRGAGGLRRRFSFSALVPARPWVGGMLETPPFKSLHLALCARERLTAARRCAGPGRQTLAEEEDAIWAKVSQEYVALSFEANPAVPVEIVRSRLEDKLQQYAPQRQNLIAAREKRTARLAAEAARRAVASQQREQVQQLRRVRLAEAAMQRQAQEQQRIEKRLRRATKRLHRILSLRAGSKC